MNKNLAIIKYTFLTIGTVLITLAIISSLKTQSFMAPAVKTEGVVTDLIATLSSRTSSTGTTSIAGRSYVYAPVVQFQTNNGKSITFESSVSSNPPDYAVGDSVQVLYIEDNPSHAKIYGFFSLWGGSLIIGGIGMPFFAIGLGWLIVGRSRYRSKKRLKQHGVKIATRFHSVEQNTALEVNGRCPYQILSKWKNPRTSSQHVFKSENIWADPRESIPEEITVFIERGNPNRYIVDLSFLPTT